MRTGTLLSNFAWDLPTSQRHVSICIFHRSDHQFIGAGFQLASLRAKMVSLTEGPSSTVVLSFVSPLFVSIPSVR